MPNSSPPYEWRFVSISLGFELLEYWRAPCSVVDCHQVAEANGRIMPQEIVTKRPFCSLHTNYR